MNRFIIAGTNSGCGKTTIAIGLMSAYIKKGFKVQPYKVGPDYIDPMFHTFVTGRKSRNLDSYLLEKDILKYLFCKNYKDADIAIIEGVMGFFDGLKGISTTASTAQVAKILNTPVILTVDAKGASLSILAIIEGFLNFKGINWNIKGIILNNVSSKSHFILLKKIIEEKYKSLVLGYLEKMEDISLKSRHLGLIPDGEIDNLNYKIDKLAEKMFQTVDLDRIYRISADKTYFTHDFKGIKNITKKNIKFAIAKDKAFNFYYNDNLDLLSELGVELCYFSPMKDEKLPKDINAIYIGGGYPEIFLSELEDNKEIRKDIYRNIKSGIPTYAECGGLLYMLKSFKACDNKKYNMVGIIDGEGYMTKKLIRFGYIKIEVFKDSVMLKSGMTIKGHEFHYSDCKVKNIDKTYRVIKNSFSGKLNIWEDGYKIYNLLAGYTHLHFYSNLNIIYNFIERL